jgi:hypothetical protein
MCFRIDVFISFTLVKKRKGFYTPGYCPRRPLTLLGLKVYIKFRINNKRRGLLLFLVPPFHHGRGVMFSTTTFCFMMGFEDPNYSII